ncbi:MAG: hypothetical protein LUM44_12340 [Pyrinomonadaceae bacterium]|nr:hypothetical protein [Pyrinomonadaceae bacterium]
MKKLRGYLSSAKIVAALFSVLAVGCFVYFGAVSYAKTNETEKQNSYCLWYQSRRYYTDATLTTSTGVRIWFCDGEVGQAGTPTPYYTTAYCECDPEGGVEKSE